MQVGSNFTATTNAIKVSVTPIFLPEESVASENHYTWAYNIHLENTGKDTVQLLNRYWKIVDANGNIQEVEGPGVVGEQPVLKPKQLYQYTSGVNLKTPSGIMVGHYEMVSLTTKQHFNIEIPAFSLDSPYETHKPL